MSGIFFKLLFKAMVPVVMLVGVMSYMMYIQGQDPLAPLKSVAGGIGDSISETSRSVKNAAANAGSIIPDQLAATGEKKEAGRRIYRWIDSEGVTHFGTSKPDTQSPYETVSVNPNDNVMDGYRAPVETKTEVTAKADPVARPDFSSGAPMSANPAKIREMLDNVNDLSDARLQRLENIR